MSTSFENLCCLCAGDENCDIHLVKNVEDSKESLIDLISKYLSININMENSPMLCSQCCNILLEFHQFALRCKETQSYLVQLSGTALLQDVKQRDDGSTINDEKIFPLFKSEFNAGSDDDMNNDGDMNNDEDNLIMEEEDFILIPPKAKPKRSLPSRRMPARKCSKYNRSIKIDIGDIKLEVPETLSSDDDVEEKDSESVKDEQNLIEAKSENEAEQNGVKDLSEFSAKRNKRFKRHDNNHLFLFACHFCRRELSNWTALKKHTLEQHDEDEAQALCVCSKVFLSAEAIEEHKLEHKPTKIYICEICGDTFRKRRLMAEHSINHISDRDWPFPCDKCEKSFTSANKLKKHQEVHLPKEKRPKFPCPECSLVYSSMGALRTHKLDFHDKEKSFICDLCGYLCFNSNRLNHHMLVHSTELNFICDYCSKGFKSKVSLKNHLDTHKHIVYQCPKCLKLLNSKKTLSGHMLVHDNFGKYKCQQCSKIFKRLANLKHHERSHTGEKPFSCQWCDKTFSNKQNCRFHMQSKHPDEYTPVEYLFVPVQGRKNFTPKHVIKYNPRKLAPKVMYKLAGGAKGETGANQENTSLHKESQAKQQHKATITSAFQQEIIQ